MTLHRLLPLLALTVTVPLTPGLAMAGQDTANAAMAPASTASAGGEVQGIEPLDYNPDDPEMRQAAARAQATLPAFFKATEAPGAQVSNVAVRIRIRDGKLSEFVWVMPFQAKDAKRQRFEGTVNDISRKIRKVESGQAITFSRAEIVDWMYSDLHTRRMEGNFTTCVLVRKAPAEEQATLKKDHGLDCAR